jgi:vesicle-fusing ATPase
MLAETGFSSAKDDSMNGWHVGVKKLLSMVEMARQEPDHAAQRLVGSLMGLWK